MPTERDCIGQAEALHNTCLPPDEFEEEKQKVMDRCCYWDEAYNLAKSASPDLANAGQCGTMLQQMEEACGQEREAIRSDFNAQCCHYDDLQQQADALASGDMVPCYEDEYGSTPDGSGSGDAIFGDNEICEGAELCIGEEDSSWLSDLMQLLPMIPMLLQTLFGDKGTDEFDLSDYSHQEGYQAIALYAVLGLAGGMAAWSLLTAMMGGSEDEEEEPEPQPAAQPTGQTVINIHGDGQAATQAEAGGDE